MHLQGSLCMLAMSTASVLSMPLMPVSGSKATLLKRDMDDRACLTIHNTSIPDASPSACGWGDTAIADFASRGLHYVSIPVALFEKDYKGSNPNANSICGMKISLTNLNSNKKLVGMVMDLNNPNPAQHCIGPTGMDHGPSSFDIGESARNEIGFHDEGLLDVVEYEFLDREVQPIA